MFDHYDVFVYQLQVLQGSFPTPIHKRVLSYLIQNSGRIDAIQVAKACCLHSILVVPVFQDLHDNGLIDLEINLSVTPKGSTYLKPEDA